jgi:hypothetical protein
MLPRDLVRASALRASSMMKREGALALLWQILSGMGFPNQFFNDSWLVGFRGPTMGVRTSDWKAELMTMLAYAFLQHRRLATARGEKRTNGPPPQPTLPAVRHAILELFARPLPQRCPHCRKWIRNERRRE